MDWLAKWEEEEEKIAQGEVVGQDELYYCFAKDLDPADWDNPDLVLEGANRFGGLLGVVEEGEEAELEAQEPDDAEKEVSQVKKEQLLPGEKELTSLPEPVSTTLAGKREESMLEEVAK